MHRLTVLLIVAGALIFWATGAGAQLKDGLWEMTTQVEIKGMLHQMPPTTFRQCLTKDDPVARQPDGKGECKTTTLKVSGNSVSYTMECKTAEGVMKTTGKHTYTGNTMEGTATTKFKMQGQPEMQMVSKMKGTYIGPCK